MGETEGPVACFEDALRDVMDLVLRNLNVRELSKLAQVNKYCHEAVVREFSRRGPQRLIMPGLVDSKNDSKLDTSVFNTKADTTIFFCGPRPKLRPVQQLEYSVMGRLHGKVPNRMVMLGVDHAMKDTMEVWSCRSLFYVKQENTSPKILALSLPKFRDTEIKRAYCVSHEHEVMEKAKKLVEDLRPDREDVKPIFLLFSRQGYSIGYETMKLLRKEYEGKPMSVWGSSIQNFIKSNDDGYPGYLGTHGFLGLSLAGTSLQARCHTINLKKLSGILELGERLNEFKKDLRLKRENLGLACGPRVVNLKNEQKDCIDHRGIMQMVKSVFTNIPFIGMFNDEDYFYYGCSDANEDLNQELQHHDTLSLMILTYN